MCACVRCPGCVQPRPPTKRQHGVGGGAPHPPPVERAGGVQERLYGSRCGPAGEWLPCPGCSCPSQYYQWRAFLKAARAPAGRDEYVRCSWPPREAPKQLRTPCASLLPPPLCNRLSSISTTKFICNHRLHTTLLACRHDPPPPGAACQQRQVHTHCRRVCTQLPVRRRPQLRAAASGARRPALLLPCLHRDASEHAITHIFNSAMGSSHSLSRHAPSGTPTTGRPRCHVVSSSQRVGLLSALL